MMHQLDWIAHALHTGGLDCPPEFIAVLDKGKRHLPPFYFLDETDGSDETESMRRQFPSIRVLPFARRLDNDGVVCVVLADASLARGQVVVIHDDAWPGHEIDGQFDSLGAWTKAATEEAAERIREGWNDAIMDRLD